VVRDTFLMYVSPDTGKDLTVTYRERVTGHKLLEPKNIQKYLPQRLLAYVSDTAICVEGGGM
jgi:hypothetical protein